MKTITDCVYQILRHQPFLEDALTRGIINFSAMAQDLQPKVSRIMNKEVKEGSIIMALRRFTPNTNKNNIEQLGHFGDIVVRSGITELTYLNSSSILSSQARLLEKVKNLDKAYFTYSNNFEETNVLVSSDLEDTVRDSFNSEHCINVTNNLSSMSISLPKDNSKTIGLYYYIFKMLANEGVPVFEVISTSNYFTLFLEKEFVNKAFLLLNEMKEYN